MFLHHYHRWRFRPKPFSVSDLILSYFFRFSNTIVTFSHRIFNSREEMEALTVNIEDSFPSLLVLASHNDFEGFKLLADKKGASLINEVGIWYGRKNKSKELVLSRRTPLMVAATYGSIDVMKAILLYPKVDVNFAVNDSTALHCAASGGSANVVDAVRLLISVGADVTCVDANGNRPVDVIVVPPKMQDLKVVLEELLLGNASDKRSVGNFSASVSVGSSSSGLLRSPSVSPPSPTVNSKFTEKKEYPVDPSFPGIRNSMYASDEFRMFSFKVVPCSRAHSHDWTDCPFVHPGENARRRDLKGFYYSCVPCPEFRKGACRYGDRCEFAHGVFECWLHPNLYRTRLCQDATSCNRKVCFFAHSKKELRPLSDLNGSAVPSPRSPASALNAMNMAAALNLLVGSPWSVSSTSQSQFSPPMSPYGNGNSFSSPSWEQQNASTFHCSGSNFQSSQLRSSLSARDIRPQDFNVLSYLDAQQYLMNDLSCFSQPGPRSKVLPRSRLEERFAAEILSSARYSDPAMNQLKQLQNMLSPSNTNMLSPKNVEHSLLQAASYGVPSFGSSMSPRSVEPISSMSPQMSAFAHREKQKQQLRSISSRDLGSNIPSSSVVGSPTISWSNLGSPNGTTDCSVNGDKPWLKALMKDSSENVKGKSASSGGLNSNSRI